MRFSKPLRQHDFAQMRNISKSTSRIARVLWDVILIIVLCLLGREAFGQNPQAQEQIVLDIFQRSCSRAGCHAGPIPQMDLNLDESSFYGALVDVPSKEQPNLKRVAPGRPDSSYLVMKIKGDPSITGVQMPLIGDKLTTEEVAAIESWIEGLEGIDPVRTASTTPATALPFYSWKAVNLPTTRTLEAGNILFLIAHRFNPRLKDGYEALYGLDGSGIIYLHLGYAVTDQFLLALARSNSSDNLELQARYNFFQEGGAGKLPVGVSLVATGNWVTEKTAGEKRFRSEVLKLTLQAPITRSIGENAGIAIVPGVLFNAAEKVDDEDPLITIGLAGRWQFYRNFALIGEWAPIVSGFTRTTTFGNDIRFDTWGGGLEIATGGHVFQILLSNSVGLTTDQYLRGGDLDIRDGDARLGFNIYRILN